ncbi:hypothetical protein [Streptomyces lunalinharesii]|uniref:Uncharacterized protein n=1 Tax=Streptomyces lunalinharesii TaxID=333384 RepID=A0ABP6F089_9ACTN
MAAQTLNTDFPLAETPYLVGVLGQLATLMRSIDRPDNAEELEEAAAALPVLELVYARLTHFQELRLDPPRQMTRDQWKELEVRAREAQQGVDWLHSQPSLPNEDDLLVRGVVTVLQAAGQGEQPIRLVREAGEVLGGIQSDRAAIVLAEGDPLDEDSWEGAPVEQGARVARAALTLLAQASRISGLDDADEQARIGLVEEARELTLQVAA